MLPLEQVYADLGLPQGTPKKPYTLINAVGTLDGRGAVGGKSTPIGSDADHRLMRSIRANVDAVLVGAGTLRSEDLTLTVDETSAKRRKERGLEEYPIPIILIGSGSIPADRRILRESKGRGIVLVFAGADGPDAREDLAELRGNVRAVLQVVGPEDLLETLVRDFGVSRLLVEGGPSVNRSFLEARLVDELFLTLAPKVVCGDARSLTKGAPLATEATTPDLLSVYLAGSELFLRYALCSHA